MRIALRGNSDLAVLKECERAEATAIRAYQHVPTLELPLDAHALAKLQLNGVHENHDRVREMRDERKRLAA